LAIEIMDFKDRIQTTVMELQNPHLNVFRFFNESPENQFIENNPSRVLTLCLQNSDVFLFRFLQSVVTQEDFSYLTGGISGDKLSADIQVNMNSVEVESYKKVYAIAIIIFELILFAGLFMAQKSKCFLFYFAVAFHFGIFLIHGLASFFFTMPGCLILYLLPQNLKISNQILKKIKT